MTDRELELKWVNFHQDLHVVANGEVVFSSVTQFVSPKLTPRQVKWITEAYHNLKKTYVFLGE